MTIPDALRCWANGIAARYGHPVWLVGSAIEQDAARDVDVVVMLPYDEFEARYGDVGLWCRGDYEVVPGGPHERWAADVGKLSRHAARALGLNVDFKVQPPPRWLHEDGPRVRLDTLGDALDLDCGGSP